MEAADLAAREAAAEGGRGLAAQLLPARGFMEQSVQELLERGLVEPAARSSRRSSTTNTKQAIGSNCTYSRLEQ